MQTLKARYVFPVAGRPLADASVTIDGDRIVAVATDAPRGDVRDLGNVAILPGLVNAHTHLEFSNLAAPLGSPGMPFVSWLETVIAHRQPATGWPREAVACGLIERLQCGVPTLGEIAQPGWEPSVFERSAVEATVFLEVLGPTRDRVPDSSILTDHVAKGTSGTPWRAGLSPHAPYTVHPMVLEAVVTRYGVQGVPLAFHLAESREELEFLRTGGGPLAELLKRRGVWNAELAAPGRRPLDFLRILARAGRVLIIHGNYLDDEEIALVAEHSAHMAVVYCPRTHAYFGHAAYPLERLLSRGATVALGTDSRASSPDLSLLTEMREAARRHPAIARSALLELATLGGARALGCADRVGSIEPGKQADLAIVRLPDGDAADPHELLFDGEQPVVATWKRGR
jgi:aminodeoxyfutalosine deaminase